MKTARNERTARKTVTDEEGVDLPSLVKRPSTIDERCNSRNGDPADKARAPDSGSLKRPVACWVSKLFSIIMIETLYEYLIYATCNCWSTENTFTVIYSMNTLSITVRVIITFHFSVHTTIT